METLLRAAEVVFAEVGYNRSKTNLIAARASVSPGTLYQFYRNKEALAEALARRYAQRLEYLHRTVFEDKVAAVSLSELIDATIKPFLEFHRSAPAFEPLFLAAAVSPELSGIQFLHDTVASRIVSLFAQRAPKTKKEDLQWRLKL